MAYKPKKSTLTEEQINTLELIDIIAEIDGYQSDDLQIKLF